MKPLEGRKVLVTRPFSQADVMINLFEKAGAAILHEPLIEFRIHESKQNPRILSELHDFNWVFFTSSNGVKFFFEWLQRIGRPVPRHIKVAVVGRNTKQTAEEMGVNVHFCPTTYDAEHMAEEFFVYHKEPGAVLYVRGDRSRETLLEILTEKGILFQSLTVYDTLLIKESEVISRELPSLDALTFTSPSTIEAFLEITRKSNELALDIPCFCIGATTAEKAEAKGFNKIYYPSTFSVEEMVQQIIDYFSKEGF
ncbi:uroporphyrinogen-III synthase [Halobacillus sp. A5]|uniref:uroporphyrinogen-III synthase n=1 Tax=Halobacillus sp. A5 TaxID=2880263 RepID=UPI0020A62353|nr:uroporphyrinogen-III synthase [Halobacillus sp. A5]MCP3025526.1 uroporphyrinogen-III synthase [Halobacillus sp. A5]